MDNAYGLIYLNFGNLDLDGFLDYASERGFTHVELAIAEVWNQESDAVEIDKVREKLSNRGLRLCALGAYNDFVVLDADEVDFQVRRMKRICEIASELGCPVLRTEGGVPKPAVPREKWVTAIVECLKRCSEIAEELEVRLALDNHGVVTNDAELQVEILGMVDSPMVGACLDTMNYHWMGHDHATVRRFYQLIAPVAMHTHIKDGRGIRENYVGCTLGEGVVDLDFVIECLLQSGYSGAWTLEYEGKTDAKTAYEMGLKFLRDRLEPPLRSTVR